MVLLGGGQFATSVDDGSLAPLPARTFTVPAFCMAKTETTVKDYQACVTAGQCKPAPTSNVLSIDAVEQLFCNGNRPDRQDHPVNCENWQMADAYCKWAGSRLPTELEWAYAAQASAGNKYPWGNAAPDETRLNACGSECKKQMASLRKINLSTLYSADDGWATTAPVAAFPGDATPTGVHGLAGNVGEWTASDYVFDYSEFSGSKCSMWCAVRGGAWDSVMPSDVEGAVRTPFLMIRGASSVGFRCARTR
jgi:formylglycine-generating enzyme required for sulfatase activity